MGVDTTFDGTSYRFEKQGSVKSGRGLIRLDEVRAVVRYTQLTDGDTSQAIVLGAVPNGAIIMGVSRKLLEDFAGGSVSAIVVDVGDGSNVDRFIDNRSIFTGQANTQVNEDPTTPGDDSDASYPLPLGAAGGFNLTATFTSTDGNLNTLTAGAIEIAMAYFIMRDPDA